MKTLIKLITVISLPVFSRILEAKIVKWAKAKKDNKK
jgi:hypothetical protein